MPRHTERHVNQDINETSQWASHRGGRNDDDDRQRGRQVRDDESRSMRDRPGLWERDPDNQGRFASNAWNRGSERMRGEDFRPSRRLMQDDRERAMESWRGRDEEGRRHHDEDRDDRSWVDRARSWFTGEDEDERRMREHDRDRDRGDRSWVDRARSWFSGDDERDERRMHERERDERRMYDEDDERARYRAYGAADPWSGGRRLMRDERRGGRDEDEHRRYDDRGGRYGQYGQYGPYGDTRSLRRERDDFGRYTGDERYGGWQGQRRGYEAPHQRYDRERRYGEERGGGYGYGGERHGGGYGYGGERYGGAGYGGSSYSGRDEGYGRRTRDEDAFTSRDRDARFAGGRGYDLGGRRELRQDRDDRGRFTDTEERTRDTDHFHYDTQRRTGYRGDGGGRR